MDIQALVMTNVVRVAAAQIKVTGNIKKNTQRIIKSLEKAKKQKIDMICFPECSTLKDESLIRKKAIELHDAIEKIRQKCSELKIWCIFGTYEPLGKKIHNTAYIVSREGKIIYKYKKVHLWGKENRLVTAGRKNKVIRTEFGHIAVITCWDFAFPSYIQKLSRQGAKIIFCPSFVINHKGTEVFMESLPVVRAFENIAYFVLCDAFHEKTASRSFIASPFQIMRSIAKKDGMIYADLDLNFIDKMRKRFNTLK